MHALGRCNSGGGMRALHEGEAHFCIAQKGSHKRALQRGGSCLHHIRGRGRGWGVMGV